MSEKDLQEALSIIWELKEKKAEEQEKIGLELKTKLGQDLTQELEKMDYIISHKSKIKMTEAGEKIARDLIRRQRIAERLLCDVFEIKEEAFCPVACEFEHILSKEVEESICTLLGHPRQCPHGSIIPEGECCKKAKEVIESIVVPLSKLKPNQKAKIVYVLTDKNEQLHRLMSLGIVPGSVINVHQTFPSFVIQAGATQIALEKDVADNIFTRKI
ncbi:MAG: hypothetical protein A2252_09865 [Elusimicrobia bacterium RIFOXYA2_FULL_39_19]|nr:MAG: hypothetical protein A2252_09865 [Elusimicrobia bacterium RIFOXYA2_FULL_39_19]